MSCVSYFTYYEQTLVILCSNYEYSYYVHYLSIR